MEAYVTKDRVLVKVRDGEQRLPSGIIIPERRYDYKNEVGMRAKVMAIGPLQTDVKVGNEVLIEKFGGVEVELGGVEYVILENNEILALVEEEEVQWTGKAINQG